MNQNIYDQNNRVEHFAAGEKRPGTLLYNSVKIWKRRNKSGSHCRKVTECPVCLQEQVTANRFACEDEGGNKGNFLVQIGPPHLDSNFGPLNIGPYFSCPIVLRPQIWTLYF